MAQHRVSVSRVRLRRFDRELGCERLTGVAWRSSCSCGVRWPARSSRAAAIADAADHRLEPEEEEAG